MGSRLAVALLSGGMDSAVAAASVRDEGYALVTLAVDYGQRSRAELAAASELSRWLCAQEHLGLSVDLGAVGGSALTGDNAVPMDVEPGDGIPVTYVPARNTVLLALALSVAEARGAAALVIGANSLDYSGYPDCRPEFLDAFQRVAEIGTRAGVEGRAPVILAPLARLSKAEIIGLGTRLGVPFDITVSCYDPDQAGRACGRCESCLLRRRGFAAAEVQDPTPYA